MFAVVSFATDPVSSERMFAMYGGGAAGTRREINSDTISRVRLTFGRNNFAPSFTYGGGRILNVVAAMHYGTGNSVLILLRKGNALFRLSTTDSGAPIDGTATARVEVARGGPSVPENYLHGVKTGAWSESEALRFLADPWQIYVPRRVQIVGAQLAGGAITGTLTATLADVTAASAGTVLVSGTSAVTLGAATLTAAGTATVTGAASITLGAATASSAGTVAVVGSASITLAATTSTAAGTVAVDGDAAITLGAVTLSAAGVVGTAPAIGSATITLAAQTLSAAGTVAVAGAATVTLADATLSATGTVAGGAVTGAALITLGGQTLASAGAVSITAAASILLDSITTQIPAISGEGAVSLDAMVCASTAQTRIEARLDAFLQSMRALSGVYEAEGAPIYNAVADDRRRIGSSAPDVRRVIN
jgi:hypothetical protein